MEIVIFSYLIIYVTSIRHVWLVYFFAEIISVSIAIFVLENLFFGGQIRKPFFIVLIWSPKKRYRSSSERQRVIKKLQICNFKNMSIMMTKFKNHLVFISRVEWGYLIFQVLVDLFVFTPKHSPIRPDLLVSANPPI